MKASICSQRDLVDRSGPEERDEVAAYVDAVVDDRRALALHHVLEVVDVRSRRLLQRATRADGQRLDDAHPLAQLASAIARVSPSARDGDRFTPSRRLTRVVPDVPRAVPASRGRCLSARVNRLPVPYERFTIAHHVARRRALSPGANWHHIGTTEAPLDNGPENKKSACIAGAFRDSGGGIRTRDLRVMSPTSYQTAPPRGGTASLAPRRKPARS